MLPNQIEMLFSYVHIFMNSDQIRTMILVRPTKKLCEKKLSRFVNSYNVTDFIQKEFVGSVICQNVLVELINNSSEILMPP